MEPIVVLTGRGAEQLERPCLFLLAGALESILVCASLALTLIAPFRFALPRLLFVRVRHTLRAVVRLVWVSILRGSCICIWILFQARAF